MDLFMRGQQTVVQITESLSAFEQIGVGVAVGVILAILGGLYRYVRRKKSAD